MRRLLLVLRRRRAAAGRGLRRTSRRRRCSPRGSSARPAGRSPRAGRRHGLARARRARGRGRPAADRVDARSRSRCCTANCGRTSGRSTASGRCRAPTCSPNATASACATSTSRCRCRWRSTRWAGASRGAWASSPTATSPSAAPGSTGCRPAVNGELRVVWRGARFALPTYAPIDLGDVTATLVADGARLAGPVDEQRRRHGHPRRRHGAPGPQRRHLAAAHAAPRGRRGARARAGHDRQPPKAAAGA